MSERPLLIPGYARILHGGDYNPDQWLGEPSVIDEDFRLMALSGCNAFSVGIFAWSSYERAEGELDFGWLDAIMDRMAAAGHRVILATPSGAKPAWMSRRYPEIRRVNRDGRREPHGGRHNHCFQSPVYREKVRAIDRRLAERYARHPALGMWHVSNELSGECYCELCLGAWHRWLAARYGTVDALNAAWWTAFWSHQFTAFEEIDPRDGSIDGLRLDHRRFCTDQVIEFVRWEIEALRELSPDVPCTTNLMGTFPGVDYSRLVAVLDRVADDQYPGYAEDDPELVSRAVEVSFKDDLFRAFQPDRPWMLMESCPDAPQWLQPVRLKRAELHRAEMLQALGHGAEGTCYFQWRKGRGGCEKLHGAVVDHVGHEHTRVFRSVAALGRDYAALGPLLGSVVEADVAVLYDWEVRWAFEGTSGVRNVEDAYRRYATEQYRALWEEGVSVDVLGSDRELSGYRLVVAPQLFLLKPGVAARLREFVARGGVLVGSFYLGLVDATNACLGGGWPGDGLGDLFGVWNEETDWMADGAVQRLVTTPAGAGHGLQPAYVGGRVRAVLHGRGAEPLVSYADGPFAGAPALTRHDVGAGAAYYQAAWHEPALTRDLYRSLIDRHGLRRALGVPPPAGVAVQRRVGGGREWLFLASFVPEAQEVSLPAAPWVDAFSGEAAGATLRLGPFGSTVLVRGEGRRARG